MRQGLMVRMQIQRRLILLKHPSVRLDTTSTTTAGLMRISTLLSPLTQAICYSRERATVVTPERLTGYASCAVAVKIEQTQRCISNEQGRITTLAPQEWRVLLAAVPRFLVRLDLDFLGSEGPRRGR